VRASYLARYCATAETILFAPGSKLDVLESGLFVPCRFLKSLCVPASVEFIAMQCFDDPVDVSDNCSPLETVTFAPDSICRGIESFAFGGCTLLRSISLPASVEDIDARAFVSCPECRIELDSGNRNFRAEDGFLTDFDGSRLIRYSEPEVTIPDAIEALGDGCFSYCSAIRPVPPRIQTAY
jgi:hypothetical protein